MPQGPIAELIRTRRVRSTGRFEELDIVVCHVDREAELLDERPDLRSWKRDATRSLSCNVVLYLASSLTPPALGSDVPAAVDRHI